MTHGSWANSTLPVAPLVAAVDKAAAQTARDPRGGVSRLLYDPALQRAYYRAKKAGRVTFRVADEVCELLHQHPAELYGKEWEV